MRAYLVGGAVRDKLLGLPVRERDWVVVGETRESMLARGFKPVDGAFPVFRHPSTGDEYALARTETKRGEGHRGFELEFGTEVTLEQDLARRDLTVNAIAEDTEGRHVDPFGGLSHLRERRLAHITPAFRDDPLRLLRAARFAACLAHLGFRLEPATLALMKEMAAQPELDSLSADRVWRELRRGLSSTRPRVVIDVLRECDALGRLLPSLPAGCAQESGEPLATLDSVAAATDDIDMRISAWLLAGLPPLATPATATATAQAVALPAPLARTIARVQRLRALLARAGTATPSGQAWLDMLGSVDALRQPDQFRRLLPVLRALLALQASGAERGVCRLESALAAALSVHAISLADSGLHGPALGEALRAARATAIEEAIEDCA